MFEIIMASLSYSWEAILRGRCRDRLLFLRARPGALQADDSLQQGTDEKSLRKAATSLSTFWNRWPDRVDSVLPYANWISW